MLTFLLNSCKKEKDLRVIQKENPQVFNKVIKEIEKKSQKDILVCAHRGFHKNAPENSLKSIQDAINANIDIVELDVRTTQDSVLVLMHDDAVDRTTTGKGSIKDYLYQELLELNLKIGDSVTTHKIPKLKDVLLLAKDKVILNLDLKDLDISSLYRLLENNNMQHDVFSFIWDKKMVDEIVRLDSLYAVLPLALSREEMASNFKKYHSTLQHLEDESYTSSNMKWARENRVLVFINSLFNEDKTFMKGDLVPMDSLIVLRPAIIQTDHPELLVQYLRQKNLHN